MIFGKIKTKLKKNFEQQAERLSDFRKERQIKSVLRKLSKQRVKNNFGSALEIEKIIPNDSQTKLALDTCLMRGWIEELKDPPGQISYTSRAPETVADGKRQPRHLPSIRMGPYHRPTDTGWAIIYRSYEFNFLALLFTGLGVLVAVAALIVTLVLSSSNRTTAITETAASGASVHPYQPQDPKLWPPLRQPSAALQWPVHLLPPPS